MDTIRSITESEWHEAMALAWKVFLRFEADDYNEEGVENFRRFVTDDTLHRLFLSGHYVVFGYFSRGVMVGMISVRSTNHISLLFVDENYQRLGVGSRLIRYMADYLLEDCGQSEMTVDSSPVAVEFYHKMGFKDTSAEVTENGIIYTPMVFYL
ncbi:MAG: GNAT family N-acetyltransferase [Lachnospiraceae bacterium]|nr:GNAT family N-acetyltransferase [Lachnospiraceae bacterium]